MHHGRCKNPIHYEWPWPSLSRSWPWPSRSQHLLSMVTPECFTLHSPYLHQLCIMVWTRILFIMDDPALHLQGHDLNLQGRYTLLAWITPERFKLHSPYSHQIWIMVRARTLFIKDDLDLQGHNTLLAWKFQDDSRTLFIMVTLTFIFEVMTLTPSRGVSHALHVY